MYVFSLVCIQVNLIQSNKNENSTPMHIHHEQIKNVPLNFCLYLGQLSSDFQNSFNGALRGQLQ